ncbi:MAG TPA: hypothetical protein VGN35_00830 [Jatrophihabitantaceae bacterium]|nr:hypothetical protein [Jatrophihabitantaceae bacterium]
MPPTSSARDDGRIVLTLLAPSRAVSGSTITSTATIKVAGSSRVVDDLGQPVDVYIVRGGKVVGAYHGMVAGTGVIVGPDARSGTGQSVPVTPVVLSGCPSGPIDYARPDATRHPLPPGLYELIAAMEDSPPGAPGGVLVAAAVSVVVTA